MNEITEIAGGTLLWTATFMSFGLLGTGLFLLLRPTKKQYWLHFDEVRAAVESGRALPHRRALDGLSCYRRGRKGIDGDAARLAHRLLFFAFLAIPGLGVGLLGLIAFGVGLLSIPVLLIALSAGRAGMQLLAADPNFLGRAEQLRRDLRFAAGWCLVVCTLVSIPAPPFAILLAPVFVAGVFAAYTSALVRPAADELRECLTNRGLSWVDGR